MYPKSSTNEAGQTTMKVVYKHILLGTPEEIAQYKAYQEQENQPFHIDKKSGKPLFFNTNHTGVNGVVSFTQAGRPFLQDDEMLILESELAQETMPEMKVAIAQEIRAIKRLRNKEIIGLQTTGANNAPVTNAHVEEEVASEEETEL